MYVLIPSHCRTTHCCPQQFLDKLKSYLQTMMRNASRHKGVSHEVNADGTFNDIAVTDEGHGGGEE